MRLADLRVTVLLGGLILSAGAWATPIIVPVGATAAVTYEGPVNYVAMSGPIGAFEGTLVSKSQLAMDAVLNVTYTSGDFDFDVPSIPRGFRWTETITNNTAFAWSAYSLQLGANGIFFQDSGFPVPTFATVSSGPTVASTAAPGTVTLSPNAKRVDLVFASSIDPGESFSLHIPIYQLAAGPGTFELAEAAVPEPGSLALLGAALGALGFARRRKARIAD
ncbi:MAG TPA: PEP-CTERM sorting domain-containing protein [Burkholderiales bacterium]|nr:PEP-CTERM sorting domain-containing protein [Burkholderiales bacterium]